MTAPSARKEIVLFCNLPEVFSNARTIRDHIGALAAHSRHAIRVVSCVGDLPAGVDLNRFDVIVLHYSIVLPDRHYLSAKSAARIRDSDCLKARFSQDEYRQTDAVVTALCDMGLDVLFSCVPEGERMKVYGRLIQSGAHVTTDLTGFVPADLLKRVASPIVERPIDVSYRARKPPYWLGKLAIEKWRIVSGFKSATEGMGLMVDLSYQEEDRLYGERWVSLLLQSKAVLGVESGASIFDFSGEIQRSVDGYVAANPKASFEEVFERFLLEHEGNVFQNQISPRCFEAAALRTAMILFEGDYSGILIPWRHYIPLRKDYSNIQEVVAALRDHAQLQTIVDTTYREIACNPIYSYKAWAERFDSLVEDECNRRDKRRLLPPYSELGWLWALAMSPQHLFRRAVAVILQRVLLRDALRPLRVVWRAMPGGIRDLLRPLFSR